MAERFQARVDTFAFYSSGEEKIGALSKAEELAKRAISRDDLCLSTSSIAELDRKDLLVVKDGVLRVAESLDREQQQLDANGEVVKALGTWTKDEHERFLRALEVHPKGPWKAIAEMVATRTVRQTQTHAQKYREKQARRMRGLRNRNGTLQTSLMTRGIDYPPQVFLSSFTAHVHTRGYSPTAYSHAMELGTATMPLARTMSLPAMPLRSSRLPHHYSSSVCATTPVPVSKTSSEFSQRHIAAFSSACMGKETMYPSSAFAISRAESKHSVPNFDESMDFLMDVYSTDPTEINTVVSLQPRSTLVTPTAAVSHTHPRNPMPSALKRHSGFGFAPTAQRLAKHFTYSDNHVNRELGV
ncbi:unnamed protein product [Hyaloperonospora brassicae]|uniref:HTH myb-type domain-containing protein n=1 Tax=Hyaloperonospora brassicae TaxID=162125 RepID=A0AAV0USH4_HYABA|nr:unnamed protein product [Hyaloperonospora brassicae]